MSRSVRLPSLFAAALVVAGLPSVIDATAAGPICTDPLVQDGRMRRCSD